MFIKESNIKNLTYHLERIRKLLMVYVGTLSMSKYSDILIHFVTFPFFANKKKEFIFNFSILLLL